MQSFFNLNNPVNTGAGVAEKILLAHKNWFVSIKSPGYYEQPGDDVVIKDTHIFKPGYGFISIALAPEKNSLDAKTIGDTLFQKLANELKVFIPGSYAELHEEIWQLMNQPLIVLIKDSNCPANMYYQLGTDCVAAYLAADFSTGTTKDGIKGYSATITNTSPKVFLYKGQIQYLFETGGIIARLTGFLLEDNTVNLDASTSTLIGDCEYKYEVFYNDINDNPQSIQLPITDYQGTFLLSDLINWNGAGFAVKLTITNNLGGMDYTRSSDVSDQQPLIMGGMDGGFSDGFDFNILIT